MCRRGGPFTGVLDLASTSTVGNWLAARDLDVTTMASGQTSSYPEETGRSRPLMCAHFDTVSESTKVYWLSSYVLCSRTLFVVVVVVRSI